VLESLWPEQDPAISAANLRAVLSGVRPPCRIVLPPIWWCASMPLLPSTQLDLALDADQFEAAATAALGAEDPPPCRWHWLATAAPCCPACPMRGGPWRTERRWHTATGRCCSPWPPNGRWILQPPSGGSAPSWPTTRPTSRWVKPSMRLLGVGGRRSDALRVYQTLVTALHEELEVTPSGETEALRAALLAPPAPPHPHTTASQSQQAPPQPMSPPAAVPAHNLPAPLSSSVGRAWERAELRQLLDRTRLLTLTGPGRLRQDPPGPGPGRRTASYLSRRRLVGGVSAGRRRRIR